ncbi:MAG: alpha/beta hydrolase [Myxococcales bacterium]|nr:alpha/beta hydrolase [Myxococcales bacterium]
MHVLYAHGFASGPLSSKGRAVKAHCEARGVGCTLLDLRVPDRDRLRLSAMIATTLAALPEGPVLGVGSSLGGLTMAHAAQRDRRLARVLLLAPAFRVAERWRGRLGESEWARWQRDGVYAYDDHTGGPPLAVDFGFIEDCAAVDTDFPVIAQPVTVIHGQRDATVDPELSRIFAARTPHARLVEVDDDHQLLSSIPRILAELDALLG